MTTLLVILALSLQPLPSGVLCEDRFDRAELNHYYDDDANHVFDQVIFWRWHETEYHAHGYRLPKQSAASSIDGRSFVFLDGDKLRRVRFDLLTESWTQFDPERCDREKFSPARRVGLYLDGDR